VISSASIKVISMKFLSGIRHCFAAILTPSSAAARQCPSSKLDVVRAGEMATVWGMADVPGYPRNIGCWCALLEYVHYLPGRIACSNAFLKKRSMPSSSIRRASANSPACVVNSTLLSADRITAAGMPFLIGLP